MRPDSDIQDGGWYTPDGESQDDLHEEINEFEADISDFLIAAADASELQVGLSVPDVLPTANTDHKIKVYYQVFNVTGAWTIRLTLKTPGGEITHDISGSDSMDSYEFDTWDIPTVDVTTLLINESYLSAELHVDLITMTADDSSVVIEPASDHLVDGWQDENGGSVDIYRSIDEGTPYDTADYALSPAIDQSKSVEGSWNFPAPNVGDDTIIKGDIVDVDVHYSGSHEEMDLEVTVKQVEGEDETDIGSVIKQGLSTSAETLNFALTQAESSSIDWDKDIRVYLKITDTAETGSAQQVRPISDVQNINWRTQSGGSSNLHQTIDDDPDNDTTYIKSGTVNEVIDAYTCKVAPLIKPPDVTSVKVKLRCKGDSLSLLRVALTQDGLFLAKNIDGLTTSFVEYTLTFSQVSQINDWSDLRVRIDKLWGS
jgi:hypothetical protein